MKDKKKKNRLWSGDFKLKVVLDKLKIDPAVASGPIISTLNDLFALLVYFGIATLIFMM